MTSYNDILSTPGGYLLRTLGIVLLMAALALFMVALTQKRKWWVTTLYALHLVWCMFFAYCTLDLHYYASSASDAITHWLLTMPWAGVTALTVAGVVVVAACVVDSVYYQRNRLWTDSIKQAIDALPVALCVGTDKHSSLINLTMQQYLQSIFGYMPGTAEEIWQKVAEIGEPSGASYIVRQGEQYLLFAAQDITYDKNSYRQISAQDVTNQYRITAELQANNAKLRAVQLHMREVGYQAKSVAMAKEVLAARVKVHDEMGHMLLLGKYYFEHVDQDEGALLKALQQGNDMLLKEAEAAPRKVDAVQTAIEWANAIGIKVQIEGDVPPVLHTNNVLTQAIRECATNAIKHAEAQVLTVKIQTNGNNAVLVFENDGEAPGGDVTETGGLVSLRHAVESAGGVMMVQSAPNFALTIAMMI